MFHQGTLQGGIAKAVEESKCVLSFITDGGHESSIWENDWLQDENIPEAIEQNAIALRLEAGSQEAGFLAAFCPISQIPTAVVIYNGQLLEQLNNGITKDDFTLRLLQSINRAQANPQSTANPFPTEQIRQSSQPSSSAASSAQPPAPQPKPSNPKANPPVNQAPTPDPNNTSARVKRPNEISYAAQQAQRKREAKLERERILRTIENDKIERREREEERRRAAQAQAQEEAQDGATPFTHEAQQQTPLSTLQQSSSSPTARIQVRLTDGNTLRSAFPSTTTLAAVREWLNTQRTDGTAPYTLKQILTPHPSRTISDAEEREELSTLGLAPSGSLIMVSAKGAVSAYAMNPGAGVVGASQGVLADLWAWVLLVVMRVVGAVRTFLGLNQPVHAAPTDSRQAGQERLSGQVQTARTTGRANAAASGSTPADAPAAAAVKGSGIRIRTLRDQRQDKDRDRQPELYNGNQLNFESNEDKDDKSP